MSEELIRTILNNLVALGTTTVLALATVALEYVRKWLKKKTSSEEYTLLQELGTLAVSAAEQVGKVGDLDNVAKKSFATRMLTSGARRVGVKLEERMASDIIESVVATTKAYQEQLKGASN